MASFPDLSYTDLLLPNQSFLRRDFAGDDAALHASMLDTIARSTDLRTPVEDFDLVQSDRFSVEEMASHPALLPLLQFLIGVSGARQVLEIGAFIGVSTMSMARALPPGGTLTTIEKFDEFAAICRENFRRNGLGDRITLINGDAFEILPTLPTEEAFDLIFLDGNKERYAEYFELLESRLAPAGLFVVDNMFCCGDALNPTPTSAKAAGVRRFLDLAAERDDYVRVLLPIYDGVMLMHRRPAGR